MMNGKDLERSSHNINMVLYHNLGQVNDKNLSWYPGQDAKTLPKHKPGALTLYQFPWSCYMHSKDMMHKL
jgi:hypothetical protein